MNIQIGTLLSLSPQVRTVIFLGTRSSDHLRELIRMAEFKGKMAYRIEQPEELQSRWFVGVPEVGIVVGAAGLQALVRAVTDRLHHFAEAEAQGMLEGVAR